MSAELNARGSVPEKLGPYLRWAARSILIAIGLFWLWFGIADGLYDSQSLGLMGFIMMLPAAVIVAGVLYIAWRWELAGGLLLLAVTGLGGWFFAQNMRRIGAHGGVKPWDVLIGLAIFVLPFLLPSVLLLAKSILDKVAQRSGPAPHVLD